MTIKGTPDGSKSDKQYQYKLYLELCLDIHGDPVATYMQTDTIYVYLNGYQDSKWLLDLLESDVHGYIAEEDWTDYEDPDDMKWDSHRELIVSAFCPVYNTALQKTVEGSRSSTNLSSNTTTL